MRFSLLGLKIGSVNQGWCPQSSVAECGEMSDGGTSSRVTICWPWLESMRNFLAAGRGGVEHHLARDLAGLADQGVAIGKPQDGDGKFFGH